MPSTEIVTHWSCAIEVDLTPEQIEALSDSDVAELARPSLGLSLDFEGWVPA